MTVGPASIPVDLGRRLAAHGLTSAEVEAAMTLNLASAPAPPLLPTGLEIHLVASELELAAYAAVIAANWDPPHQSVLAVYARTATGTLASGSPARYHIGYLHGEPVAASECFLASGVAGIYNVVTLPPARHRGIGTALTAAALETARTAGFQIAVLHASADGRGIYARLGFVTHGEFHEYKPGQIELPAPVKILDRHVIAPAPQTAPVAQASLPAPCLRYGNGWLNTMLSAENDRLVGGSTGQGAMPALLE